MRSRCKIKKLDIIFTLLFLSIAGLYTVTSKLSLDSISKEAKGITIDQLLLMSNVITRSVQNQITTGDYMNAWYTITRSLKEVDGALFLITDENRKDLIQDLDSQLKIEEILKQTKFNSFKVKNGSYYKLSHKKDFLIVESTLRGLDPSESLNYKIIYIYKLDFLSKAIGDISSNYLIYTVILIFIVICYFLFIRRVFNNSFNQLGEGIKAILSGDEIKDKQISTTIKDHFEYKSNLELFKKRYDETRKKLSEQIEKAAFTKIAKQVAHDIKSPLAALDIVMEDIKELPEDSRDLTLHAIGRIKEIANDLSKKNESVVKESFPCLVSNNIAMVMNEKQLILEGYSELELNFDDQTNKMQFININPTELSRLVSNLINNAVQAINHEGKVSISLKEKSSQLILKVEDSGAGFPEKILSSPITRGQTIGKDEGQGLGLFHAYETTIKSHGEFKLYNNNGACVEIVFPICSTPTWFNPTLKLTEDNPITIIDDDSSIHDLWKKVFKTHQLNNELVNLRSETEIISSLEKSQSNCRILMDHDLRMDMTGLDLIKKYGLINTVLVTSAYDSLEIQKDCSKLGIQLLPKYLIQYIEIV